MMLRGLDRKRILEKNFFFERQFSLLQILSQTYKEEALKPGFTKEEILIADFNNI